MAKLRDLINKVPVATAEKSRDGWYDKLRARDPVFYRDLYELVAAYEQHDAELRARFHARTRFLNWLLPMLRSHGVTEGFSAIESYCRRVAAGDQYVKP